MQRHTVITQVSRVPRRACEHGCYDLLSEEVKMRKAFKVATAFTGAAACAAAFTPAAEAVTAPAPKTQVVPDVVVKNCAIGGPTTSMVFTWSTAAHHGPTCVGSAGVPGTKTLNHFFSAVCTGNNIGWLSSGNGFENHFGAGNKLKEQFVENVHISRHAGGATCPT